MGNAYVSSPEAQRDVVSAFFARMACKQSAPCTECLAFCREYITPRAYPILKQALLAAVRKEDVDAGFGAMMMGISMAEPGTWDREDDDDLIQWIEGHLTLHKGVDLLYVVDGYQVDLTDHDGNIVVASATKPTLEAAIAALKEAGL